MKIMVTGGAGFIGSHLVDRLITEGHQVMILDDFSTGNKKFVNPKAELTELDIRDTDEVNKFFKSFKPEAVFHLAAQISIRESTENPEYSQEVNVQGSQNIISASKEYGVKKIVFSSTAAVYGENQNLPLKESEPIKPTSPYGEQKMVIEKELEESGIPSIVLRFANAYGPRQGTIGEGGVIGVFCQRLNGGEPLNITGNGEQTRDFVFVDDIVDANIKVLECDKEFAIYNVSTTKETSINNISEQLLSISQKNVKVEHSDTIKSEVVRNSLDNRLIKEETGWSDKIDIQEGLINTWEWFNKNI
ncbi:MAG: NAD-dependent epimerase/dehydratase family protein [Candidatus Cloacimonetes bacterium]|jgi:UDP-glucose 4-epimerase|nr:NAD-dependent epimerase/dehydratase family protein [Candidatus Cloacimonadota bacterium]